MKHNIKKRLNSYPFRGWLDTRIYIFVTYFQKYTTEALSLEGPPYCKREKKNSAQVHVNKEYVHGFHSHPYCSSNFQRIKRISNYSYSNTNIVKILLLSNASAQFCNLICIQYAKYEICIFMNIDENTSASSEIDE